MVAGSSSRDLGMPPAQPLLIFRLPLAKHNKGEIPYIIQRIAKVVLRGFTHQVLASISWINKL